MTSFVHSWLGTSTTMKNVTKHRFTYHIQNITNKKIQINNIRRPHRLHTIYIYFRQSFGCPKTSFGPLPRGQLHLPNVNHCHFHYFDQEVTGSLIMKLGHNETNSEESMVPKVIKLLTPAQCWLFCNALIQPHCNSKPSPWYPNLIQKTKGKIHDAKKKVCGTTKWPMFLITLAEQLN